MKSAFFSDDFSHHLIHHILTILPPEDRANFATTSKRHYLISQHNQFWLPVLKELGVIFKTDSMSSYPGWPPHIFYKIFIVLKKRYSASFRNYFCVDHYGYKAIKNLSYWDLIIMSGYTDFLINTLESSKNCQIPINPDIDDQFISKVFEFINEKDYLKVFNALLNNKRLSLTEKIKIKACCRLIDRAVHIGDERLLRFALAHHNVTTEFLSEDSYGLLKCSIKSGNFPLYKIIIQLYSEHNLLILLTKEIINDIFYHPQSIQEPNEENIHIRLHFLKQLFQHDMFKFIPISFIARHPDHFDTYLKALTTAQSRIELLTHDSYELLRCIARNKNSVSFEKIIMLYRENLDSASLKKALILHDCHIIFSACCSTNIEKFNKIYALYEELELKNSILFNKSIIRNLLLTAIKTNNNTILQRVIGLCKSSGLVIKVLKKKDCSLLVEAATHSKTLETFLAIKELYTDYSLLTSLSSDTAEELLLIAAEKVNFKLQNELSKIYDDSSADKKNLPKMIYGLLLSIIRNSQSWRDLPSVITFFLKYEEHLKNALCLHGCVKNLLFQTSECRFGYDRDTAHQAILFNELLSLYERFDILEMTLESGNHHLLLELCNSAYNTKSNHLQILILNRYINSPKLIDGLRITIEHLHSEVSGDFNLEPFLHTVIHVVYSLQNQLRQNASLLDEELSVMRNFMQKPRKKIEQLCALLTLFACKLNLASSSKKEQIAEHSISLLTELFTNNPDNLIAAIEKLSPKKLNNLINILKQLDINTFNYGADQFFSILKSVIETGCSRKANIIITFLKPIKSMREILEPEIDNECLLDQAIKGDGNLLTLTIELYKSCGLLSLALSHHQESLIDTAFHNCDLPNFMTLVKGNSSTIESQLVISVISKQLWVRSGYTPNPHKVKFALTFMWQMHLKDPEDSEIKLLIHDILNIMTHHSIVEIINKYTAPTILEKFTEIRGMERNDILDATAIQDTPLIKIAF